MGHQELYDVAELSKLLDIQERTLRRYVREGRLKGRKMARKWYVTGENPEEYFRATEGESEAGTSRYKTQPS